MHTRATGRTPEEAAGELVRSFLARGLVYRTDRKYKQPKPGRTKLVKWPRTLLLMRVRWLLRCFRLDSAHE